MKQPVQSQYEGFLKTPNLWEDTLLDIVSFRFNDTAQDVTNTSVKFNQRLGKRIEQFLALQLQQDLTMTCIAENIQVKKEKQTIGEIDMILLKDGQPIHLEIAYKFYLYDPSLNTNNPLSYWIGPNRKDNLSLKLNKLKERQLPLLYYKEAIPFLEALKIDVNQLKQQICFKAQLFLPFKSSLKSIAPLNSLCIAGFYLRIEEVELLSDYLMYVPHKLDWLVDPINSVRWQVFEDIQSELSHHLNQKRSPLLWLKSKDHIITKCFLTWW